MVMLKLSLWRMRKQVLSQVLLTLQLVFLMNGILITTSTLQEYWGSISVFKRIQGFEDAVYWTMNDEIAYSDDSGNYVQEVERQLMETGLFRDVGNMNTDTFRTAEGYYDLQIYNDAMAENLRLPLKAGTWFSDQTGDAEMLVDESMARKYPVGSAVEATFLHVDPETGGDLIETATFHVVGVLDMRGFIFDLFAGGSALRVSDLLNTVKGYAIIRENACDVNFRADEISTRVVFLREGLNAEERERAAGILRTTGEAVSFQEIAEKSYDFMRYRIGYELPQHLMLILLGLLGMMGSMIVSYMMSRRENAIYVICGIQDRSLIGVEWIRCGITALVAYALTFAVSRTGIIRGELDLKTYLISFAVAAMIIIAMLAIASTQIVSANPIDELRRND